jgi:hypothetical protein
VLESGKTVWDGPAAEAKNNSALIDAFLGLKKAGGSDSKTRNFYVTESRLLHPDFYR